MKKKFWTAFVATLPFLIPLGWLPSSQALSHPTPTALHRAEKLAATRMGVDRLGNLWAWNRSAKSLRVLSPDGDLILTLTLDLKLPTEVDFDAEWGVAALDGDRELVVFDREGAEVARRSLDHRAGDLAWIDAGRLAVSPKDATHRVEVWNVTGSSPVARWGHEEAPSSGPGYHRLRAVLLRYDFERHRLWSLETFTGHVAVFSNQGEVLGEQTVPHPHAAELADFLEKADMEKRKAGEVEEAILHQWPSLALDPRGHAWLVEGYSSQTRILKLREVAVGEPVRRHEIPLEGCGSLTATVWDVWLVSYRSPVLPGPTCIATRRLP